MLRIVVFVLTVFVVLFRENYKCVARFHNRLFVSEVMHYFTLGNDKDFDIVIVRMVK